MSKWVKLFFSGCLMFLPFLARAEAPTLPANLQWQTNDTDPVFADPNAKRGGRFRTVMLSFPPTLRMVGPDASNAFSGFLRENTMSLVGQHPTTLNPIPGLATHWAFGADGKSVYFKLDPDARWSDGVRITADDYLFVLEFMRSKFIVDPWYNNYYSEVITDIIKFDDYTIGVIGANSRPPTELLFELNLQPEPKHFHKLDENWVDNYNWKIEPNTGPYAIDSIRKGKYVEFKRKADWWANNKRYFAHRFNPDYVRVKVIRDMNVAYQNFTKGELDSFGLTLPRLWYKKANGVPYDSGYIGKIKFFNDVPQSPQGFFLNEDDPILADPNVRYGIAYSLNFAKLLKTVLRGDYERLQTMNDGYGDYTNHDIKPREFDLAKANHFFEQAGWNRRGGDGVRIKNGQRLSLRISYGNGESTDRLILLKQEAANAGLELTLQLLDGTAAFKQISEKKHQIAWLAFGSGGGAAPSSYWEFFHSVNAHKPQTNNITNTDNKTLDNKIDAYKAATDLQQRIKLAHEIEQLIYEDCGFIPGYKVPYSRQAFWRWLKLPAALGTKSSEDLFDPFGGNVIADSFGGSGGLFWIDEAEKEKVQKARILGEKFPPINIVDETWRVKPQ
ncbi:MAG: peptide transporter substrate-binding protein [Verrucomicrobiaceae bacterium]|nr:peptide transporter substrate-binding protein [Verrucomicrobiaceae bacterium]